MPHEEPEDGEEFVPKAREPQGPKRKRGRPGRPRKLGVKRRKKSKDAPDRLSPSQRKKARWITVTVPADAYVKLKEIAAFRKTSMSQTIADIVEPVFDKVYEESMLLLRIEQRRQKEEEEREAQRRNNPTGRTHF
jgi:hypothetical protein